MRLPIEAFTPLYALGAILIGLSLLWFAAMVVLGRWKRSRQPLPRLAELQQVNGIEFERALRCIFERDGWRVSLTPKKGDFGADLVLSKEGKRVVVQAKRWTKPVGIRAVQEALGARDRYRGDEAWVVTTSSFTRAAIQQAKASAVVLKDGTWLARKTLELASQ